MPGLKRISDVVFQDISSLGGMVFYLVVMAMMLVFDWMVFLELLLGLVILVLITVVARLAYFKHRPRRMSFRNLVQRIDASSFPSLHAARIVLLAFTLHFVFNNAVVDVLLGIAAVLVCYSRHRLKRHFTVDILSGAALGLIVAAAVHFLM
jgi:membrane-associated phospholipid phosphatase